MKPAQIAVLDQVVRMLVVSREADVTADIVHQRCVFQPFALAICESMHPACLIEECERQTYHLIGVLGVIAATLGEFQRAPSTDVRDAVDLRNLAPIATNVVEDQPFTERQVAERQFLGAQAPEDCVEQNHTGHDQVGASGVKSGDGEAVLEVELGNLLSDLPYLLHRDVEISQLRWSRAPCRSRSDRSDAENGAGRADHAVETGREDLFAVTVDFAEYMLDDLPLVALGERVAPHEAFGQSNRSDLEAAGQLQGAGGAERNLDAAAADVDNHGASAAYIDSIHGSLMDEARLFDP